ncbi:unnamed protein product [Ilex paraguariensis]|uniref:WRKY domain-containing protein n=1 Tax=Ilex paraguariensis TaxID=185542 RepID=A0ABC8SHA4_9AQUA
MISEFAGMEDWGLHAVVRGCNKGFSTSIIDDPLFCFGPKDDNEFLFNFPGLFETNNIVSANELEELYKPFYPLLPSNSPQLITTSSISFLEEEKVPVPVGKVQEKQTISAESTVLATASTTHAGKYKRRRNQQKRVVLQVTAEGLSSDMWAWRKYGQKPIKGSPYPRSYYRCSSSKGCLARKQVEQSCSDPGMFIMTYTAEHSHTQPTRRNSLAGTTRQKFLPHDQKSGPNSGDTDMEKAQNSGYSSPISTAIDFSPATPLIASVEEESPQIICQERKDEDEEQMVEMSHSNEFTIPDLVLSDDFFAGLEDLDELISDCGIDGHYFTKQSPVTFCS